MDESPLLRGYKTNTPLDLITYNLYFLFPMTQEHVDWLNKTIYKDNLFDINNWSLTHLGFGIIWGLFSKLYPNIFTLKNLIIFHTIFEIWELWTIHLIVDKFTIQELVDIIMDTIFAIIGFYLLQITKN